MKVKVKVAFPEALKYVDIQRLSEEVKSSQVANPHNAF